MKAARGFIRGCSLRAWKNIFCNNEFMTLRPQLRSFIRISLLLVCAFSSACQHKQPTQSSLTILHAGDHIWVYGCHHQEKFERNHRIIDDDGTIQMPGIGRVKIGGLSPQDAEWLIKESLERQGILR